MSGETKKAFYKSAFILGLMLKTNHYVSYNGHIVEKTNVLEGSCNALMVDFVLGVAPELLAVKIEGAKGRLIHTCKKVEYSCLTCAVRTDKTVYLVFLYLEVYVLRRLKTAEGNTEVLSFKNVIALDVLSYEGLAF